MHAMGASISCQASSSSLLASRRSSSAACSTSGSGSSSGGWRTTAPPPAHHRRRHHQQQQQQQQAHSPRLQQRATSVIAAAAATEAPPPLPFTPEELRQLSDEAAALNEEALADAWAAEYGDDPTQLYGYAERDQALFAEQVAELFATPRHLWEQTGVLDRLKRFPPGVAADIMGMGTWRLNGIVDEVFSFMTGRVESSFRELLADDVALYPPDKWKAKGWDFVDSMDPKRELMGFSYVDLPSPSKGEEGYPRLLVENRVYSSRAFRKLHLEVAWRQDGLQVLHMVLYPRYDFDLPILALDVVAAGGSVTLAIVDACPVSTRLTLPPHYANTMLELQRAFLPESAQGGGGRAVPEWGSKIFSPLCVCMRPTEAADLAGFMKYAIALTRAHLMYSRLLQPLSPIDKPSVRRLAELLQSHRRFCDQQLANAKTARVLEVAFDRPFTDAYMKQLMFDFSPREDVPWFDGALARLYQYFRDVPEVWADAGEFLQTKLKLDEQKASEYLRRFLARDKAIKLPRLAFALQVFYDTDPDFQASVDDSIASRRLEAINAVQELVDQGKSEEEAMEGSVGAELLQRLPLARSDVGEYLARELQQLVYGRSFEEQEELQAAASRQEAAKQEAEEAKAVAAAQAAARGEGGAAGSSGGDGASKWLKWPAWPPAGSGGGKKEDGGDGSKK